MSHQFTIAERIPARSNRAEVRNPVLTLPAVAKLRALDTETRRVLQDILIELQQDARQRAEASWRSRKPPLAAYWAACGVYAGHIARALGPSRKTLGRRRAA
jgi:hypothetical protein